MVDDDPQEKAVSAPSPLSSNKSSEPGEPNPGVDPEKTMGHRFNTVATLLVVITALPVVALVLPNTASYVAAEALRDLGLGPGHAAGLVRAVGLALPAMLLAVPLWSVIARRAPAGLILFAGLLCVLMGQIGAQFAGSLPMIGAVRALQGIGAGAILPATLVFVWERWSRVLITVWAGVFTAALVLATPLAMRALPVASPAIGAHPHAVPVMAIGDWRGVLQPYPWLIGIALAAAALCMVCRFWVKSGPLPVLRHTERTQLLLPLIPVAGFAFLAVVITYGWSPGAQLFVGGMGLATLLGLALAGARNATTGSAHGFEVVVLTTGLLTVPVVAPLAGLAGTRLGPHDVPLLPFAVGAAAALAGALGSVRLPVDYARTAVLGGHGLAVIAVLIFLTTDAASSEWLLMAPFALLGAGIGMALAVSLRSTGLGSALFGLTLCFPAVLTGYLIVGPLQVAKVNEVMRGGGARQDVVYALTAAFRTWLIAAGVIAVLMGAGAMLAGRPRGAARSAAVKPRAGARPSNTAR